MQSELAEQAIFLGFHSAASAGSAVVVAAEMEHAVDNVTD